MRSHATFISLTIPPLLPRGDPGYDKLGKVRPVIDILWEQFLQNYNPHREKSVDEAMIKFKGRSSMKQYPKKQLNVVSRCGFGLML